MVVALPLLGAVRQALPTSHPALAVGRQTPPDYHTLVQGNSHVKKRGKLGKGKKVPGESGTIHSTPNHKLLSSPSRELPTWSDDPPEANASSGCQAGSGPRQSSPADLAYPDSWTACPLPPLKNSVYLSLLSLEILKVTSSLKSALAHSLSPSQSCPPNSPSRSPTSFQAWDTGRL